MRAVTGQHAALVLLLGFLVPPQRAGAAPQPAPTPGSRAESSPDPLPAETPAFRLFPAPPSLDAIARPLAGLEERPSAPLLRLPGDPDSVFSLGGPGPSGEPCLRLAVEVNEVLLKALAPEPNLDPNDSRGRAGGDWKPLDSAGRPYQLRFGARLIW